MAQMGRPKGSKGKRTLAVEETLARLKCNPIEALAKIAQDKKTPLDIRVSVLKELAQYVAPKKKAVELSTGDKPLQIEVVTGIAKGVNSAD